MTEQSRHHYSEDSDAGLASPLMDLIAAGVLVAISLFFIVESLRLPMPGGIITAPGLLPFLTAGSLLVMAVMLGANALTRRRAAASAADMADGTALPPDFRRSMGLGAVLIIYVAALQFVPVEMAFQVLGLRFFIGAFEVVSIVVITAILRFFWQQPLWTCLAVSAAWIAFLSIVFRMIFIVPLP
jgi:hypothetical protein